MVSGVVDSDYTGKIKVLILLPTKTVQINKGQKLAQLLLLPYYQTEKPWLLKLGAPEDLDLVI